MKPYVPIFNSESGLDLSELCLRMKNRRSKTGVFCDINYDALSDVHV